MLSRTLRPRHLADTTDGKTDFRWLWLPRVPHYPGVAEFMMSMEQSPLSTINWEKQRELERSRRQQSLPTACP